MITLNQSPEVACKKITNDLLFSLINRDYGPILGKISYEYGKWTSEKIQTELLAATRGKWPCEFLAMSKSTPPLLTGDVKMYEYRHRLPIDGKWSEVFLSFRLHQKNKLLYALELVGFGA